MKSRAVIIWNLGQGIFYLRYCLWYLLLLNHSDELFRVPLKFASGSQAPLPPLYIVALDVYMVIRFVFKHEILILGLLQTNKKIKHREKNESNNDQ